MSKLFLTICLICLCACSKQPEKETRSVTRKPAQLEVKWTQVYDIGDPTRNKTTISPEIEAKLLKLGPYQSQYTINIRSDGSIISFRVIYLDEIKHDQADVVLPLIRETLAPAKFEVIFHPAEVTKKNQDYRKKPKTGLKRRIHSCRYEHHEIDICTIVSILPK